MPRSPAARVRASYAHPQAWRLTDLPQTPLARRSAWFVILGIATVVGRLHELMGPLRLIRPIFVVVAMMAVATLSARKLERNVSPLLGDRSMQILYAYLAWMVITIPTSIDRGHSIKFVFNMLIVFVFATLFAAQPVSVTQVRMITRGFFCTTAVFGLLLIVFGYPVMDVDGLRYAITASLDPNDCAAFLAIGAPMALAEARRPGPATWRALCAVMLAIIGLAIVRTGSRGGFIAVVAGITLVYLADRGVKVLITGCVFGLMLLVGREVAPQLLPARFASIGHLEDDYNLNVYGGRVQIWKRGLRYFAQDPVFGVGVASFEAREGIQMAEDSQPGHWSAPHSAYVQAFVELGLMGGVLFLLAIGVSLRRVGPLFRVPSPLTGVTHPEYLAAVAAFSISAVFLSHAYFWGFFALVALCALADRSLVRR